MQFLLTSRAMLLKASSSAEKRSFSGARFLPEPCVPMLPATIALAMMCKSRRYTELCVFTYEDKQETQRTLMNGT